MAGAGSWWRYSVPALYMSAPSNKAFKCQQVLSVFIRHLCFYSSSHLARLFPLSAAFLSYFKGQKWEKKKLSFVYYWSDLPVRRSLPSSSRETAGHFPGPGSPVCAGYWRASVLVFPRRPSCCSSEPESQRRQHAFKFNPPSQSTGLACVTLTDKDSLCSDMGKNVTVVEGFPKWFTEMDKTCWDSFFNQHLINFDIFHSKALR